MKSLYLNYTTRFILLGLIGCGGGGSEGSVFTPGPYNGSTVFIDEGGDNIGNCRAYVEAALGSFYSLYVTEQFFADSTSEIVIEHELGSGVLATVPPNASSVEFSESIHSTGFYGTQDVTCDGTRTNLLEARSDLVISLRAQLGLICRIGTGSEETFNCAIVQNGEIQAR